MPVVIMPIILRQIRSHLVVRLRIFQNLHINIHNAHTLSTTTESGQSANKGHNDLRETRVTATRWTTRVGEDDSYMVRRLAVCNFNNTREHPKPQKEDITRSNRRKKRVKMDAKHTTSVLKRPSRKHRVQKQRLSRRIMRQPRGTTIIQRPECRHDDQLGALSDELAECFGKREIPADQHADFTYGRVEDFVRVAAAAG